MSRSREMARSLPALRPGNEYLFAVQPAVAEKLREIDARVRTLTPPPPFRRSHLQLAWHQLLLPRAASSFRPQAVIAPFNVAPLIWRGSRPACAVIVSNLAPYSEVVTRMYRGVDARRLSLLRRLTDATLARADCVFVQSEQAFDLIDRRLIEGKVELIPMPPPNITGVSADVQRPPRPYVIVAGDLVRYKGVEVVLRGLAAIEPSSRPFLLLCGRPAEPHYVRTLKRLVEAKGLEHHVAPPRMTPHDELLGLMGGAVACIACSRFENPGRVQFEAMALGTPVIASDIRAHRETCGDAALYFPLTDPKRLADHLRTLVHDEAAQAEWAARGLRHTAHMSPTDASSRILSRLETVVSG